MDMYFWQMTKAGQPLSRVEAPLPKPGPDQVLVKVAGCGVCHTDLGFYYDGVPTRSPLPLTLGHEISGIVQGCGAGAEPWQDKAVIIPAVMPCGVCDVCRRGLGNICRAQKMPGNDIPGGFASHLVVPAAGLCEVEIESPDQPVGQSGVSLAGLSVIADALTTPYQAIIESGLSILDTAIFVGAGGVGGFGALIAKSLGALTIAIDVDQERLTNLAPYVDLTLNAGALPFKELRKEVSGFVREKSRRLTEWKIFETSGTAAGQQTAFGLLTFGAYLAVVGYTMDKVQVRLSNLMAYQATARGNWGCLPKYYPKVLKLVTSGWVQIGPFIEEYDLDRINEVFEQVHTHQTKKRPVLVP